MNAESNIHLKARALGKKLRKRLLVQSVACSFATVAFGWLTFIGLTAIQRVGASLLVAGMIYFAYQLYATPRPARTDDSSDIEFYRSELKHERDFHGGSRLWLRVTALLPGVVLFCVGGAVAHPESALPLSMIAALIIFALVVPNIWCARNYQRQIDELDKTIPMSSRGVPRVGDCG